MLRPFFSFFPVRTCFLIMDQQTIREIVSEIGPVIAGRTPGRIFQLNQNSLAIDFRVRDSRYLFISVEPAMRLIWYSWGSRTSSTNRFSPLS